MSDSKFIFADYDADFSKGEIVFRYGLKHGEEEFKFSETIAVPIVDTKDIPQLLLNRILENLSIALGVSYWKLFCPKQIDLGSIKLNKDQADFWNTVWTKGLGEFFYQNKIDFRALIQFPFEDIQMTPTRFPRKNRSLVGIGGGKDSIVVAELLKKDKKDFEVFIINQHPIKQEVVGKIEVNSIVFKRDFDKQLFELNKRVDAYNGHIPVSSQYAFFGILASILYDFSYFIVGNEESANYGNVQYLGEQMNHQWSKSLEFEMLFRDYCQRFITLDVTYFSLLRPLKEIKIAEIFAKYPEYFHSFASCNGNFRLNGFKQEGKWCGKCAKCLFVFVMLSAFLPKEQLTGIFGKNLLGDESLLPLFKELLGLENFKPFECVGTPEEVQYALILASKRGKFVGSKLMDYFEKEVLPKLQIGKLRTVMQTGSIESIPEEFKAVFGEEMLK